MNEIERAIEYLEPISKHPTMSGMYCEHLKTAVDALQEKSEREKGCEWCKAPLFNPDAGNCQLVFYRSKKCPNGEYAISVSVFDEYGEEQEPTLVQIDRCIRCGKRLEVDPCQEDT